MVNNNIINEIIEADERSEQTDSLQVSIDASRLQGVAILDRPTKEAVVPKKKAMFADFVSVSSSSSMLSMDTFTDEEKSSN